MTKQLRELGDAELDRLLAAVDNPPVPLGAEGRLMRKLAQRAAPARPPQRNMAWLSALPLAASLVVGIYLGMAGASLDWMGIPQQDSLAALDEAGGAIGIEDMVSEVEDGST